MVELAEKMLGKGYELLLYDENIILSEITGTNKDYIEKHIPHLTKFLSDDLEFVISNSEVIVVAHKDQKYVDMIKLFPEKIIIDLVRCINPISPVNYEGICW